MTLSASLSPVILDTVLTHLALLFLTSANGDRAIARGAASQMLAAYRPENEAELNLAADIVSFSFQALEALGQAATPDTPLTKVLRLRGSAVSLSREAHKAQRKLDQQQKLRLVSQSASQAAKAPAPPPEPTAKVQPAPIQAAFVPQPTPATTDAPGRSPSTTPRHPGQTWTQAYQQRQAARRVTENLKKNQAAHAAREAAVAAEAVVVSSSRA